jgi:hypothetical protein
MTNLNKLPEGSDRGKIVLDVENRPVGCSIFVENLSSF